jgi:hypothetical protein
VAGVPRLNVPRFVFDPVSVRKVIENWETIAQSMLHEANRRLARARDEVLNSPIDEILCYPGVPFRWREPDLEGPHDLIFAGGTECGRYKLLDVQHRNDARDPQRRDSAGPRYRGFLSG